MTLKTGTVFCSWVQFATKKKGRKQSNSVDKKYNTFLVIVSDHFKVITNITRSASPVKFTLVHLGLWGIEKGLTKTAKNFADEKNRCIFASASDEATIVGAVVQLVRMPACHAGGRGFESLPHRKQEVIQWMTSFFSISSVFLASGPRTLDLPFHKKTGFAEGVFLCCPPSAVMLPQRYL